MATPAKRGGYALVTVLLFNVLFLILLGVAWRQTVGVIRVATVRAEQVQCDQGVTCALARAMHMLETGRPPIGSANSYQCYTTIGSNFFVLTFTPGTDPTVEAGLSRPRLRARSPRAFPTNWTPSSLSQQQA